MLGIRVLAVPSTLQQRTDYNSGTAQQLPRIRPFIRKMNAYTNGLGCFHSYQHVRAEGLHRPLQAIGVISRQPATRTPFPFRFCLLLVSREANMQCGTEVTDGKWGVRRHWVANKAPVKTEGVRKMHTYRRASKLTGDRQPVLHLRKEKTNSIRRNNTERPKARPRYGANIIFGSRRSNDRENKT